MFLLINSCVENKIILAIYKSKKEKFLKKEIKVKRRQAEKVITILDFFLKKHNEGLNSLCGIIVVKGPGNFTSLRAGVSAANALAYALNIPLIGISGSDAKDLEYAFKAGQIKFRDKKIGAYVEPVYGKEPNITSKI